MWNEVCALLEDPDRLVAMAEDRVDVGQAGQVDYARRITDLEKQVAANDAAISAAVVAAAKQMPRPPSSRRSSRWPRSGSALYSFWRTPSCGGRKPRMPRSEGVTFRSWSNWPGTGLRDMGPEQ